MRKSAVSSILTVRFDGQFWVGIVERIEDGRLSACRVVFGAEPSNEEVLEFVLERWTSLLFSEPVKCEPSKMAGNPKRRQREAAREVARHGASTKAQIALAEQRETWACEKKARARALLDAERRGRFEQKQEKTRKKKRGH